MEVLAHKEVPVEKDAWGLLERQNVNEWVAVQVGEVCSHLLAACMEGVPWKQRNRGGRLGQGQEGDEDLLRGVGGRIDWGGGGGL